MLQSIQSMLRLGWLYVKLIGVCWASCILLIQGGSKDDEKVMEMPKVQPALVLAVADELLLLHICVRHATQMRWVLVSCIVL